MILTKEAHPKRRCDPIMSGLSVRHEMFVRSLIVYKGNQTKAYLEVYENCSIISAPSKASRLVRNGNILNRVYELLTGHSVLFDLAVREIKRSLDAERVIRCQGNLVSVPDYRARLAAVRIVLKLLGEL